ncbi:hypothetical protein BV20DRAFT_203980 [Pilatotrama ljubarskyi]|nr:hypothetical protein BV20DRAFT_203980 [Pilatotrama ljubarskyi]
MSDYNPYVNTTYTKAEQHVAVSRASHGDMASGSGYEEPPPSYGDVTPGPNPSHREIASAHHANWADVQHVSIPGASVYQPPPGHAPRSLPVGADSGRSLYPETLIRTPQLSPRSPAPHASHAPYATEQSTSRSSRLSSLIPRGKDVRGLIEPPPPSFLRPPARGFPYGPFEPLEIPAAGKKLDDGFITALPPSSTQPHPFSTHDVREEDWMRFLGDIKLAGSLSVKDKIISGMAPAAMGLGIIPGESYCVR